MDQIIEACQNHGNPFFFQFHHGLMIRTNVDSVERGEFGNLEFRLNGELVLELSQTYVELISVRRPDNLITNLEKCLKIRQIGSRIVLGWLCWPKAVPKVGESQNQAKEKEGSFNHSDQPLSGL